MSDAAHGSIKVLIVDDQPLFSEGLRTILQFRAQDIEVVGIASNGEQAIEAVGRTRPDIVLLDVRMPIMDGVEATKHILERYPGTLIVMLTTFDDPRSSSPLSARSGTGSCR
jgi:YesN/AraC family two-component response regulator